MAVGAHPDDIEFMMAGTLRLLKDAGASIHMWSFSDGRYGSIDGGNDETAAMRLEEAKASAAIAGATFHEPLAVDQDVFYRQDLIRKAASVVRTVRPDLLLIPAPDDYMEDHVNTSRIMVTAAFLRVAAGYATDPPVPAWNGEMTIYHAMPFGLRDQLGRPVEAEGYVDIGSVTGVKEHMLKCYASQQEWLDASQWVASLPELGLEMARKMGAMSGFSLAEGWRRHSHIGYSSRPSDPLAVLLGARYRLNATYGGQT